MSQIEANKVASVHYTGTFPDSGDVFDSSRDREPLAFLVGHRGMIPGFEQALLGAKVGETRTFTLSPDEAYGHFDEDRVVTLERGRFPEDMELEVGMQLISDAGPFVVTAISDTDVTCDFNHRMAGKSLKFEVEVISIRGASEEEIAHGHVHGPGGHQH